MILYLTGPPGAGKSSAGKLLAEKAEQPFIDLDLAIEEHTGKSISDIFTQDGEYFFRCIEKELLHEYSVCDNAVIAVGGGAVLDESNRQFMRNKGTIMLLVASPETLWARIEGAALHNDRASGVIKVASRPLLTGDSKNVLRNLLYKRAAAYCDADGILDTTAMSLQETADYLLGKFYEK